MLSNRLLQRIVLSASLMLLSAGCSSDPSTPVGSEFVDDGTLGSKPGEVFEDTLFIAGGDTSFVVSSTLAANTFLTLGTSSGYKSSILLKVDFSGAKEDSGRTVSSAVLRLRFTDQQSTAVLGARFYELTSDFSEKDTITALEHSAIAIPDSGLVNVDREIKQLGDFSLPPALVQGWIDADSTHKGIAIISSDTTQSTTIALGSHENSDAGLRPFLEVNFTDGFSRNYFILDDATFVESLQPTPNLVVSDGYARRIYLPLDLSGIISDAIIHRADLVLHLVPGSMVGNEFDVRLYVPGSSNPDDPAALSGRGVTVGTIQSDSDVLRLSVRNILLLFISGAEANNGFVLEFNEGSQIRQAEFYSSAADSSLRPSLRLTYSSPPEFDR